MLLPSLLKDKEKIDKWEERQTRVNFFKSYCFSAQEIRVSHILSTYYTIGICYQTLSFFILRNVIEMIPNMRRMRPMTVTVQLPVIVMHEGAMRQESSVPTSRFQKWITRGQNLHTKYEHPILVLKSANICDVLLIHLDKRLPHSLSSMLCVRDTGSRSRQGPMGHGLPRQGTMGNLQLFLGGSTIQNFVYLLSKGICLLNVETHKL